MSSYFGHILIREGIISIDQLRAAIGEQRLTGRGLGEVLIDLGYASEHQLVDFLSKEYGFPVINLDEFEIDPAVLNLIPIRTVLKHNLVPVNHSGSTLFVAMSDPSDIVTVDDLRFATGCDIKPVIASERAIKIAIEKHYVTKDGLTEQKDEENSVKEFEAKSGIDESSGARSKWDEFTNQVEKANLEARQEREKEASKSNTSPSQDSNIVRKEDESDSPVSQEEEKEETFDPLSLFHRGWVAHQKEEDTSPPTDQNKQDIEPSTSVSQEVDLTAREWISSKNQDEKESFRPYSFSPHETGIHKQQEDASPEAKKEGEKIMELSVASEKGSVAQKEDDDSSFKERQETRQEEGGFKPYSFSLYGTNVQELKEEVGYEAKIEKEVLELSAVPSQDSHSLKEEDEADHEAPQEDDIRPYTLLSHKGEPVEEQEEAVSGTEQKDWEVFESGGFNALEYESSSELDSNVPEQEEPFKPNDHPPQEDTAPHPLIEGHFIQETVAVYKENAFSSSPEPREKEERLSFDQRVILVVDDSPTIQKIVSIILEQQGYLVLIASDGMQAVAKLNEAVPDSIFLDVDLPHMDGYQVCKIIKGNGLTKDVPVIMLTGRDGFFDKVRGRMAGATSYITKPFQPATLLQAVEKNCRDRGAKQQRIRDTHMKSDLFSVKEMEMSDERRRKNELPTQDERVLFQSEIEQGVVLQNSLILVLSKLEQIMVRLEKAYKQPISAIQLLSEIVNQVVEFSETMRGADADTVHLAKALTRGRDKYPMLQLLHTHKNRLSVQTAANLFNSWASDPRDRQDVFSQICQGMISILESYCLLFSTYFQSSGMRDQWREIYGVFLFDLKKVMNKIQL
jgi:DNA-binding response OmpR family regulator